MKQDSNKAPKGKSPAKTKRSIKISENKKNLKQEVPQFIDYLDYKSSDESETEIDPIQILRAMEAMKVMEAMKIIDASKELENMKKHI